MSTVVTIMDRHGFAANTDIIVLVDPSRRRLLWIPRDLWCEGHRNRINTAYKDGGHKLLRKSLLAHGLEAKASLCISREATELALREVAVTVPVPSPMSFAYPLAPTARIEDGQKIIVFKPPVEILSGERIHQWIGARGGSDLHRIERQKVFLRRLLDTRFDFRSVLRRRKWYSARQLDHALGDLGRVESGWQFDTLGPLRSETIEGKQVLVFAH